MPKIAFLLFSALLFLHAETQTSGKKFYENYYYKVECKSSIENSVKELSKYLDTIKAELQIYNKVDTPSFEKIEMEFFVSKNNDNTLKKTLESLGALELLNFEKVNFEEAIAKGRYEKALLDEMKKEYAQQFKTFHEVKDTQSMRDTIDLIHNTDKDIYELQKKIKSYKDDQNFHHYKVLLQVSKVKTRAQTITVDGKIVDSNITEVKSIFTPSSAGLGMVFLQIESPLSTFSQSFYMGYDIKYMFNEDQQYMRLITANAFVTPTIGTVMNKVFMLSYGRNFYPLHFRDKKSFLSNLYSGVDLGLYMATTLANVDHLRLFGTVNIGYEIYGNSYFFVDFKLGYFLPFWSDEIKNFRGPSYNLSFNLKL